MTALSHNNPSPLPHLVRPADVAPPAGLSAPALERQVGGSHYKNFPIQPFVFCQKNNLRFGEGEVVKRICAYTVNRDREELAKAKHEIDLILEVDEQ